MIVEMRGDMGMVLEHEMSQLQAEVADIRADLEELAHFIKGNGDPTRGLLWLVADQSRLVANLSAMHEANRLLVEQRAREHLERDHYARQNLWTRLMFRGAEQVIAIMTTVVLLLLVMGVAEWVRKAAERVPQ